MTVIYDTDLAKRYRVEIWNGFDIRWNKWNHRVYKTAEDAIMFVTDAKKTFPNSRFRVVEESNWPEMKGDNR